MGESESDFAHWLACWERLRLSEIHGFPLWTREVHALLHASFAELRSISERTALGIASLHEVLAARPPGAGSRDALPSLTA